MTTHLIGSSSKFQALLQDVERVAPVDSAVLIQGETGTGKEVIAKAIHEASPRRNHRFVALNCAAIPGALLESELFGHERGAFTGAWAQTKGRFQMADGGTLFLDEIGDMPLALQVKLLRALQEREFEPLGQQPDRQSQRTGGGGNEPGSCATRREEAVPGGFVLSLERHSLFPAAVARTHTGYRTAHGVLRRKILRQSQEAHRFDSRRRDRGTSGARLAWDYPRIAECHRAGCAVFAGVGAASAAGF